jgi:hypothetical protein
VKLAIHLNIMPSIKMCRTSSWRGQGFTFYPYLHLKFSSLALSAQLAASKQKIWINIANSESALHHIILQLIFFVIFIH